MDKNTSEIAKLTERISRDPKSKLFVPLAEEYKKSGDIEMAVHVLTEGLKNNPGYITARCFLGRLLLEIGDMIAARREFEEVIKTVPDNLLAQKKLGDLHVLLGNQAEALKYYKAARSLNPADGEIASLVSDLEAGVDVRSSIVTPKTARVPQSAITAGSRPVPQQKTAEDVKRSAPDEAAGTRAPADETGLEKGDATKPSAMPELLIEAAAAATAQIPSSFPPAAPEEPGAMRDEETSAVAGEAPPSAFVTEEPEVAEEVLVVEPLEDESPLEEAASTPWEEKRDLPGEMEPTPSSAAPLEEEPAAPPEPEAAVERTGEVSDDFTTDTLAELYLGQGFYEKAIDIYERMLADHPDSRALRDKLDRVKTLAASSEVQTSLTPEEPEENIAAEAEATFLTEAPEPVPSPSMAAEAEEITLEADLIAEPEDIRSDAAPARVSEDLFEEPKEYRLPSAEAEESAGVREEQFVDSLMAPPTEEFTGAKTESPAFEAREYTPPDVELTVRTEEKEHGGPKQERAHRKEVIDRLENWLKTIKKEI